MFVSFSLHFSLCSIKNHQLAKFRARITALFRSVRPLSSRAIGKKWQKDHAATSSHLSSLLSCIVHFAHAPINIITHFVCFVNPQIYKGDFSVERCTLRNAITKRSRSASSLARMRAPRCSASASAMPKQARSAALKRRCSHGVYTASRYEIPDPRAFCEHEEL